MKNFVLLSAPRIREESWLLIDDNGDEYLPFSIYIKNLTRRKYSKNTIESYAGHIARFIDYMTEASKLTDLVTEEFIVNAMFSYEQYLLFGQEADDSIAREISIRRSKQSHTNPASLASINAAIKLFLTLSALYASGNSQSTLFNQLSTPNRRKMTLYEKKQTQTEINAFRSDSRRPEVNQWKGAFFW